jgi:triosephosphate isomerase
VKKKMLKTPIIIINFKTYRNATGERAVSLAKKCEKVANEAKANIAVAVQASDIYRVSKEVSIPVLAEHIDDAEYGSNTGDIIAEDVKENGAVGTLLNHSEKRLSLDVLRKSIQRAKEAGLDTVVCATNADEGKAVSELDCDFIAVEPPELIGGDISVSTSKPELISESVKMICGDKACSKVIVGAGVHDRNDVRTAIKLGAVGVLVASAVTKSDEPEKVLKDLAYGLK